jgi:hypothetical protein
LQKSPALTTANKSFDCRKRERYGLQLEQTFGFFLDSVRLPDKKLASFPSLRLSRSFMNFHVVVQSTFGNSSADGGLYLYTGYPFRKEAAKK